MNERIEKLSEQCQLETYGINGELLASHFDAQKFAQLMVLDFIEIVASSDPNRNLPKKRPTTKILGEPYESIITRIEEHFGVDE
jgi:hypothetical protein